MSNDDSVEARQENEFEALQAIYGEDLKDLRTKAAWNKWCPLNLSITLTPQRGSSGFQEVYVQIDLHITCSSDYPNSVPKIQLENSKGLSNATVVQLYQDLNNKALEFKGEEMIFQLCQYVEEFLHSHNKPARKSLYDEMLQTQREKKLRDLEQKQLEEDKQRQHMIKEVRERQAILKSEGKLRKEIRRQSSGESDEEYVTTKRHSDVNRKRGDSTNTELSDEWLCQHTCTKIIEFGSRKIQRGRCIKHSSGNTVFFSGIDTETGELVAIHEWRIEIKSNELYHVQRQLSSIEQEINYLIKLKHQNLAHYLGFRQNIDDNQIVIHLLSEFVCGANCSTLFINQNVKIETDFLKCIAKGVLLALEYLHRNNVFHKDLNSSCVYLNEKGEVKLTSYSIPKRLMDLIQGSHGTYGKKNDIYDFGKMLLNLLIGEATDEQIDIPNTLQSDLYDFISKCTLKDEKERHTAVQLLTHPFFRKSVVHFSPQDVEEIPLLNRNTSPELERKLSLISNSQVDGHSRINSEFEFLQHLGKGAFGDVIKVRNKLDGGYYAIKRIQLNPKNKTLNRKIIREVLLLSRLNHENVVRYYNSWIETTTIKGDDDSSTVTSTTTPTEIDTVPKIAKKDEFTFSDDIEKLAPPMKNVEVSITYDSKSQVAYENSSDEDSSDDENEWAFGYQGESDSDSIEFEKGSEDSPEEPSSVEVKECSKKSLQQDDMKQIDFMYIQMEFCEKSTLRTAIDDNLYQDEDRVWRLFREIVEGLAHIHQQGMIHRDLKPVNIFLDSSDHVKIGDFGLATTIAIRSRHPEYVTSKSDNESVREDITDESKTGLVGTALYVAPEINSASKTVYNQKVDIYSLGIIFFEMCYKPLETSMERIKVLTRLRTKDVIFPDDCLSFKNDKQQIVIRWLLDHDISKRPTSQELLQSEHIPPPVLEERELRELVRHTLSNPQLKGYKYLIASCFKQSVTPAQDITYDKDTCVPSTRPLEVYDFVKNACIKVFKQHGGQNLATPLLMPKSKYYNGVESCVKLMTHFGNIVSLPHDLRVPFARYIAWNNITLLRRYSIERVYREKKIFGFIPRDLYECAFDIVSPSPGGLMADAEVLYIVYEIINELPGVKNKHFEIRLNHTSLLKALLLHCGIKEKHEEIFQKMTEIKENKAPKQQMQNILISHGLSDSMINMFLLFFNTEFDITKALNQFQMITKKKSSEASHLAKQALQELRTIAQNAEAYGVKFDILIAPGLVYNFQQYSGMICQFVCEVKKKHKQGSKEVLAAGGRYDAMISFYRNMMEQANMLRKDIHQSAVGISISLDKLVQAVQKEQSEDMPKLEALDAVVCSIGMKHLIKEKTKILRSLWGVGIRCCLVEATNSEDLQEQLNELRVSHAIILKESEQGTVIVRSWDRESRDSRYQEKQYSISDLVENMQRILKDWGEGSQENNATASVLSRTESKTYYSERNEQEAVVDILFVTADKLSSNARKRYENQVRSQLGSLFQRLSGFVVVLGVTIESNVIRSLASFLDFETESQFHKSVSNVISKHQRLKQYLGDICDEIFEQKMKKTDPIVVLYSLTDNFYKLVV